MDKQAELDTLAAEIIEAGICSELASQATQLVMGDGNADADIVFIGEAPGKNEDLQGKPFVGAAGKFLDEKERFCKLLAPNRHSTSSLYRVFTPRYVGFLNDKDAKKKISLAV